MPKTCVCFSSCRAIGMVLLAGSIAFVPARAADDYLGAQAVLARAEAIARADSSDSTEWSESLRAFTAEAPALPPDQSARRWLELFDKGCAFAEKAGKSATPADSSSAPDAPPVGERTVGQVFSVLPPPAAWKNLAELIQARPTVNFGEDSQRAFRETLLRAFAGLLGNRYEQAWQPIAAAADFHAGLAPLKKGAVWSEWDILLDTVTKTAGDPAVARREFDRSFHQFIADPGHRVLDVPDLVTLVGEEKAADYLRQALLAATPDQPVGFSEDGPTLALARRIAAESMDQLKSPPWELVAALDCLPLYEAIAKRFPPDTSKEDETKVSSYMPLYHLLDLIKAGRVDDANALALQITESDMPQVNDAPRGPGLPQDAVHALEAAGYRDKLFTFFDALLRAHPDLPFWEDYEPLAAASGHTELVRARLEERQRRNAGVPEGFDAIKERAEGLLAADKVDEGIALLRSLLSNVPAKSGDEDSTTDKSSRLNVAANLLELGHLLQRPALVDEAIGQAEENLDPKNDENSAEDARTRYVDALSAAGRTPRVEQLLAGQLGVALAKTRPPGNTRPDSSEFPTPAGEALARLVRFYHETGRPADVLTLFTQSPDWGADDLSGWLARGHGYSRDYLPVLHAARALKETGQPAAARRAVDAYLDHGDGGNDAAYALLLELDRGGDDIPGRLDELFARDPFEERPLIWKAHYLFGKGQLEAAEKLARQAIRIDPSDGDEGKGDRMRAYSVLGEILAAKGDHAQAGELARAVRAIRESEEADDFKDAGLITRAIAMYRHALDTFADAYCVQSRIALQLAAQGRDEESQAHFVRAFELMPESFGRMETHCFGCEGVFRTAYAQGAAERIFTRFAAERPGDAQVQYLLGYLKEEQEKYAEALPHFREAVRLDPDYLNAWKHLADLAAHTALKPAERDAATLNLVRLDPGGRHVFATGKDEIADLSLLWQTAEMANARPAPALPASLYPLAASRDALAAHPAAAAAVSDGDSTRPPDVLRRQKAVKAILEMLGKLLDEEHE